jgi:hypothetical protein
MTEGRTWRFAKENPHASYIYFSPDGNGKGIRLTLELKSVETSGKMLEEIRERASRTVNPQAGSAVKYLASFRVVEARPLI